MTTSRLLVNAAWPAGTGPPPVELAAVLASAGGDGIGLPDSPRLFADPFVASERVLASTGVRLAGPCVLGLGLRPAATVGAGLRTLAEGHAGRVIGVLARGESSVRNEGLPVPTLTTYLAALETVTDVLGAARDGITLLGAASGPRTIAATASRLGGVLLDVGVDPDVVGAAVEAARRTDPDVRCWLFVRAVVTASATEARESTAGLLGSCAGRLVASPEWYRIPSGHRAAVGAIAAAHDYRSHGLGRPIAAETTTHALVRERFFLTGDAPSITSRLRALDTHGIDGVVLAGATGGLLQRLRETVAALRAGLSVSA